jgi:hypothetical protein
MALDESPLKAVEYYQRASDTSERLPFGHAGRSHVRGLSRVRASSAVAHVSGLGVAFGTKV